MSGKKPQLALYWAASCGGCDVATLDVNEKILDVAAAFDIRLWPIAMDFKYKDIELWADNEIDVCLFNGAVRNSEQLHLAKLLRRKSKVMVAFGACASFGGIPGLANLHDRKTIFEAVYGYTVSTHNPDKVYPAPKLKVSEGELTLPDFFDDVFALHQVIPVEYFVPGCPPTPETIMTAVGAIIEGKLPPAGSTIGINRALCDECKRTKSDKPKIERFYRPQEILTDPDKCLLEQGLTCQGSATRGGCGALCPSVNMPCRGCYGPMPSSSDAGADALSAMASIVDASDEKTADEKMARLVDPLGTFYRFTLPVSLLVRSPKQPQS
ncbi:MAG: oxidoreductase [Deltaproteobacteria bacterium]|nr:oxidoreductase [Deltaproteobacteria bacterium]